MKIQMHPYKTPLLNSELESKLSSDNSGVYNEEEFAELIDTNMLLKSTLARFVRHIEFAQKYLYNEKSREIRFGFIKCTTLNAFAYASPKDEDTPFDFIGINIGGLLVLYDAFMKIMSHPENFKDVGDSSIEVISKLEGKDMHLDIVNAKGHSPTFPNCPIRSNFAQVLTLTALDFLFFHEIGHLRNGHLEYYREYLNFNFLPEAFSDLPSNARQDILQALEMDADALATTHTLQSACQQWFVGAENIDGVLANVISACYGSIKETVSTVLFSIYIFFRIFDQEWRFEKQHTLSHPMPAVRMSWIPLTMLGIAERPNASQFWPAEFLEYLQSTFMTDSAEVILNAELSYARIKTDSVDFRMLMSTYETPSIAQEYLQKLADVWSTIRPYLNEYKRGGVLAPQQA